MTRNFENVTIRLDRETARWIHSQAAKRNMSVSGLVGEVLRERMDRARYFSQEPGVHRMSGQRLPTRDELHDRDRLR